ncbi:hypothetical protein FB446DRAFT_705065 [Lentinula raphanica]|nr:hypothetical protein FB446DRAFT_705065 [Lentinula raphanica]
MGTRLQLEQDSAYNNRRLQGPNSNEREYDDSDSSNANGGNLTFGSSREQIEMLRMLEEFEIYNCEELKEVLLRSLVSSRVASRTVTFDGPNSFTYARGFTISGGTFDAIGGNQNVTMVNRALFSQQVACVRFCNSITSYAFGTSVNVHSAYRSLSAESCTYFMGFSEREEEKGELSSVNSGSQYAVDASSNVVERQHHNQGQFIPSNRESQAISSVNNTQGGSWEEVEEPIVEIRGPNVFAFAQGFALGPDTTLSPGAFAVVGGNQNIDII